ncbi:hypothetical protein [uncultured Ruminococcus sp.]|uniref:hypothetical protein n=1 Tax=uncultured Ruminococcus sp. TaxID=165186 RepID=UPI0025CD9766|nr:hypothetical protein [uncultured Ruminococcus sp.]
MKKRNILLLIPIMLALFCFCGCAPDVSIDIECNGLEEGESVFVLTRPTDDEELKVPEDADLTGSEIYTAEKDGFVLAEQTSEPFSVNFSNNAHPIKCSLVFRTTDSRMDFCENHKVMRLAVCDENWKIKNISDDIELVCSDKHAVVVEGKYNVKTGSFERTELIRRSYRGLSSRSLYIVLIFWEWTTNAVLFFVMLVFIFKERPVSQVTVGLWFGLMSLFNVPVIVLYLAESLVPYLNIYDEPFGKWKICTVLCLNSLWIADWLLLLIYHFRRKREGEFRENIQKKYASEDDMDYIMTELNRSYRKYH